MEACLSLGDEFYFTPVTWYVDGDNWTIDLSEIGSITEVTNNDLEDVYVVPNPYRAGSSFNSVYNDETIYFRGLPISVILVFIQSPVSL